MSSPQHEEGKRSLAFASPCSHVMTVPTRPETPPWQVQARSPLKSSFHKHTEFLRKRYPAKSLECRANKVQNAGKFFLDMEIMKCVECELSLTGTDTKKSLHQSCLSLTRRKHFAFLPHNLHCKRMLSSNSKLITTGEYMLDLASNAVS